MTKSVKDKIKDAQPPTDTVPICLRGDLFAEHQDLERRLASEAAVRDGMLNTPNAQRRQLAEQIRALEEQMAEETIVFHLRALGKDAWREMITEHQPREGVEIDRQLGLNSATFWPDLLKASVYDPDLDDEDWANLLAPNKLNDEQFERLCNTAWSLNRRKTDIPFSLAASVILRGSVSE